MKSEKTDKKTIENTNAKRIVPKEQRIPVPPIDLKKIIKNNIFEELFDVRQEEIMRVADGDAEELKKISNERKMNAVKLEQALLRVHDKELREELDKALKGRALIEYKYDSYYNEKFYRAGVSDALKIAYESLSSRN